MRKYQWQLPITLVFVFLGILLSLQFQAQSRIASDLSMQKTENLIAMVRGLSEKRQKLSVEIADLSNTLRSQVENDRDEKKLISNLKAEVNKLSIVTGTTGVKGPGLEITIEKHMPVLYIDIINIVNELWAAGAEAIAINEHRVVNNTVIFYAEDNSSMFITVNNYRLSFPIIIRAIGNSNNLEKGLTIPGGIMDNLALFHAFPQLAKADSLVLPPVMGTPLFFFLDEYKPPEAAPPLVKPANPAAG